MAKTAVFTDQKPTHEEIAERARAIYEQSGRIPGRDEQNWLQAESELLARHKHATAVRRDARPVAPKPAQIPQRFA